MKRCPTCSRVYDDLSLRFCLDDGTELVNKLPDTAPPTAVLASPINPAPTMETPPPQVAPVHQPIPQTIAAQPQKRRGLLPWIIGAALLIPFLGGIVAGGWMLFHKQPLKLHLTLELDPNVPDRDAAI